MTGPDDGLRYLAGSLKRNNLRGLQDPVSLQEGLPTPTDCGKG